MIGFLAMMAVSTMAFVDPEISGPFLKTIGIQPIPHTSLGVDPQAIIQRFLQVVKDQSTWFLGVPVLVAGMFARLEAVGEKSKFAWRLAVSIQTTIVTTILGGMAWNFYIASRKFDNLEMMLMTALTQSLYWLWAAWAHGLIAALFVALFLLTGLFRYTPKSKHSKTEKSTGPTQPDKPGTTED